MKTVNRIIFLLAAAYSGQSFALLSSQTTVQVPGNGVNKAYVEQVSNGDETMVFSGRVKTVAYQNDLHLITKGQATFSVERVTESVESKVLPATFERNYVAMELMFARQIGDLSADVAFGYRGKDFSKNSSVVALTLDYKISENLQLEAGLVKSPRYVALQDLLIADAKAQGVDDSFDDFSAEVETRFLAKATYSVEQGLEVTVSAYQVDTANAIVYDSLNSGAYIQTGDQISLNGTEVNAVVSLGRGIRSEFRLRAESLKHKGLADGESYYVALEGDMSLTESTVKLSLSNNTGDCDDICFTNKRDDRMSLSSAWVLAQNVNVNIGVESVLGGGFSQPSGFVQMNVSL